MTNLKEYIKNSYPNGIREDAFVANSITDKYDEVRGFTFGGLQDNIGFIAKQLLLTTSTLEGIQEWENYLKVYNPNRTPEERRSFLLSRVTGNNSTLSTMKSLVYMIVGGDANSVTFVEYWKEGATGDTVFTYEVKINDNYISLDYDTETIRTILELLQPAHCTVIITITNDLLDAISLTDTLDSYLLTSHIWGDGTGAITWGDGNPETGYIWGI